MSVQNQLQQIFNEVFGQTARLRKGGFQLTYHCPFCADKNLVTQKLEIAIAGPAIGNYHCWRCNIKGKTFGSLLRNLKASPKYRDAIFKLTGDIRILRNKKKTYHDLALPDEFQSLYKPKKDPEYRNALNYLIHRGLTKEDIVRYNIGYCETGPYAYHIIIPSYDSKGMLNFFMGRRYYSVEGACPHRKPDVSMDIVGFESFINYNEPIILVESAFNAITIRRNAIPLFGKYPSKKLFESLIKNKVKKVYVFLDSDANKHSISVCENMLKIGITPYFVEIIGGKDPNEIGFENSWKCINNAIEVDFKFLLKKRLGM